MHTITLVFVAKGQGVLKAGDDARSAIVASPHELPDTMAFDHRTIIEDYVRDQGRRQVDAG